MGMSRTKKIGEGSSPFTKYYSSNSANYCDMSTTVASRLPTSNSSLLRNFFVRMMHEFSNPLSLFLSLALELDRPLPGNFRD